MRMDHSARLSEILYVCLSRKIGAPSKVTIRRDVWDVWDLVHRNILGICYMCNRAHGHCAARTMLSGSYREGFRFESSDRDYMAWPSCSKLINDFSQLRYYNSSRDHNIILMEYTDTSPGFVRLQILTPPKCKVIRFSLIKFKGSVHISSSIWREEFFQRKSSKICYRNVTVHGPCASGYLGDTQFDQTVCFSCKYWPITTENWIKRCRWHKWPPASVLQDILNNGYHCVPIGSKCETTENELEWRLSFSLAEQKLVYIMNRTQFLCYGLLKIFLKEVISNNVEDPLLCSYFIKTTMFWLIQIAHLNWCPNNLLGCFWMCFKYLIFCVYRGKFANFFIPQNNMFKNKIVGAARESLLEQLTQYYSLGVSFVLLSPALRSLVEPALNDLSLVIPSSREHCYDIECNDICFVFEVFRSDFCHYSLNDYVLFLMSLETILHSSMSAYQLLTIQYWTADFLARVAFMIVNNTSNFKHKQLYCLDRMLCNILKLSSKIGVISHSVYLAMYYYRTGRYNEALYVTNRTKQRLSEPCVIHGGTGYFGDRYKYREYVSGLSLSRRIKIAWAVPIRLHGNSYFLEELTLEHSAAEQNSFILIIPPSVLVEMLSVLSNYRLGNTSQYEQSLTDLHTLLLYDDGSYVPLQFRGISWQILGICQQLVGDLHGALQSYQESLRQKPVHKLQESTKRRIDFIQNELCRNARE
ncbi:uncharacterized protein LOC134229501 [Saccostrea cucullata]|uniref:uncharacterized protein LOC134229501 n=1 Tax=Saccostrea cuccullata TaxID=36930 RepID=UPI002ED47B58